MGILKKVTFETIIFFKVKTQRSLTICKNILYNVKSVIPINIMRFTLSFFFLTLQLFNLHIVKYSF